MELNTHKPDFVRYLKDEKFIEWKFLPTDELNRYWEDFLQEYPDELENMRLAEAELKKVKFLSFSVTKEKREKSIKRLQQSLQRHKRNQKTNRFIYVAASIAALFFLLIYIGKYYNDHKDFDSSSLTEYIVGNKLESEEILFITDDKTLLFEEDIEIQISDNKKCAKVKTNNNNEEISIAKNAMNKLIVPYGKRSKISLPDGTQVWLNSGSTLEFPSDFSGDSREISLSGEMYIEVAPDKNKSFCVQTSDLKIKVYGTKFNVTSYLDSRPSVVLIEGSVSLQQTESNQELHISPNEQAIYENGTLNVQKVDVQKYICWKDGYLTFNDTPMNEVLKQIGRYYNLSFSYSQDVTLQEKTCSGKIILSNKLENVLKTLALISSTRYEKENDQIYIY
ncbi:MAG: FecR domain-containing protein [Massilibacteroides sp.]|nr:FecR domain-containing protein [Massilibacteroides sp.]MDD3061251.1 FecR domain-containing protein [Massilibacteroides sp.]MDD4115448.1 FecR domain-containing protein [Massilibacteroides sp.]